MSENLQPQDSSNLPRRLEPTSLAPLRPQFTPPPEEERDRISLHEILAIISRRRWLIATVAVSVLLIAAIQVFTATPLYKATATIQIDPEQPKIELYEQVSSFSTRDSEEYLFTQARNLQTKSLAGRVIERLDLAGNPSFVDPPKSGFITDRVRDLRAFVRRLFSGPPKPQGAGAPRFLDSLFVQVEHNTRLVHVVFSSPDPELAAAVANATVDEFVSQSLEVRFEATQRASAFLQERLGELRLKVEESEAGALRYARENDIVNIDDKGTVNRRRLIELNEELTQVEGDLIEKTARYRLVQNATPDNLPTSLENARIQSLKARVSEVESKLASLSASYGPAWPAIAQHRTELEDLQTQLRSEGARAITNARRDYQAALDHRNQLVLAVNEQRTLVERLDESSIQHNLQRGEVDANKQLYEGLLERLKETAVASGLKATNIRLVDGATVSTKPDSPRKFQALLLGLLLGLLMGLGLAFLLEAFDKTLKTPDDVNEHLHLPTMGLIPGMGSKATGLRLLFGRKPKPLRSAPFFIFGADSEPSHGAAEAYRSLRTSIALASSDQPIKTIMVTSSMPSEGKTTTSCNLAAILAQTGHQTAIMDLDLRRSKLAKVFEVADHQGMSTFLSGNSNLNSLLRPTHDPKLFVVPAGPHPPNPAELVASQRMQIGLGLLAEHFTYVVIDTPPASGASDALALSRLVDGVLIVVRSGQSPIRATKMLASSLMNAGARVLGVVINDAALESRDFDYYPGNYYYSNYYAPDEGA